MTSVSDEKGDLFFFFFFFPPVQGTGGSPTGPDPENRLCDQDNGSSRRPVPSGLQVLGEPGHFHFSFKMSFNCTSRDD